ncbi:MAG: hypothetical protein R3B84_10975 [Zavarzinella sp.]
MANQRNLQFSWAIYCRLVFCILAFFAKPGEIIALCGLYEGAIVPIERVKDPTAAKALRQQIDELNRISNSNNICIVCHLYGGGGPRNDYGNAANVLLSIKDREAFSRSRKAGNVLWEIPANPLLPNSPTFGELFQQGRLPAIGFGIQAPQPRLESELAPIPLSVQVARQLVKETESKSPWEIMQLSRTEAITTEVAAELARFRGEMLILGIKSLSPELAKVLSGSKVASIWLHSVTSVSPEAASTIANFPGELVMTGLSELESVPLAQKLVSRKSALSFPYLYSMSSEIADVLARNTKGLTLSAITKIPVEVQDKLAETSSILYMPNLASLDSMALAKVLIQGSRVFLPNLRQITVEQARLFSNIKSSGLYLGGIYLPASAVTPIVVSAITQNPVRVRVTLVGTQQLPAESLEGFLRGGNFVTLRDVSSLTQEQIRVLSKLVQEKRDALSMIGIISLPRLKNLDSPAVALALGTASNSFPNVTSISRDAADALGKLPEATRKNRDGMLEFAPSGVLSFPVLEELSPETALLLTQRKWQSISFPALQDYSVEMIKSITRQSRDVTLGLTSIPEELVEAFDNSEDNVTRQFSFPNLIDLSPKSARTLVSRLNKEIKILNQYVRLSNTPNLKFGGDYFAVGVTLPTLKPEVALELAKYHGTIYFFGLGELPDQSAEAFSTFQGRYLFLAGPGVRRLTKQAAGSLAKLEINLQIELRELDSVPLAEKFARQISWTLQNLEFVSKDSVTTLIKYKQFFNLRQIVELDSPELAGRLLQNTYGPTLPAATRLSPEAAAVVAKSNYSVLLGLEYLDSAEVARSLTQVSKGVNLPRLRAASPEVIAILKSSKSIKVENIDSLYLLSLAN